MYMSSLTARKLSQVSAHGAQSANETMAGTKAVQQAGVAQLSSLQGNHASHSRGVLAVGSQHDAVVAEFETCMCTLLTITAAIAPNSIGSGTAHGAMPNVQKPEHVHFEQFHL